VPFTLNCYSGYEDELVFIWMIATDKDAVSQASHQIEHTLRYFPEISEADAGGLRRLKVGPLTVVYKFSPDDCRVDVVLLKYEEPPPPGLV
jgi:hypothetical protein